MLIAKVKFIHERDNSLSREYNYAVTEELATRLRPGMVVIVEGVTGRTKYAVAVLSRIIWSTEPEEVEIVNKRVLSKTDLTEVQ